MKMLLKSVFFIILVIAMTGCITYDPDNSPYAAKGYGDRNTILLSSALSDYGAKVFDDGNSCIIVLPNRTVFTANSANFTKKADVPLDLVYGMVSYYTDPSVAITGYFRETQDYGFSKALAMARAGKVAKYLWKSGVNANFVYADTQGVAHSGNKSNLANKLVIVIRKPDKLV